MKTLTEKYNNLTEDEIEKLLGEASRKKAADIALKEYQKKLLEDQKPKVFTAEELFKIISGKITIDENNEVIVKELCLYFTGDERTKLDLKKGIMLRGSVGCGKTTLMEVFKFNQHSSFFVYSCRQITYAYTTQGVQAIQRYNAPIRSNDLRLTYNQEFVGCCFDDLGTEEDKRHFGNESNVMAEILLNRYDNLNNLRGKTHITTNLSAEELEERYGTRVRSRIREMFNDVLFTKPIDRRK